MPKANSEAIASLEKKIAAGRKQLHAAYQARGCTDSVVLLASIKLDKLINQYHRLTMP